MVLFKYGNCSSPQYIFPSPSIPSSLDNTTQHNKYKATHSENDSGVTLMEEQKAIEEAASEGLKGMEHLVRLLSHQPSHLRTDVTVSSFKKLISLLNRTGHARFRRAPLHVPAQSQSLTLDFTKPNIFASKQETFSVSSNSTSFMSSALTADTSVSIKNNRHDHVSGKLSCSTKCHCVKRRKNRMKKTVRVPAISSKNADIPPDEYSWRKYGQKPIKGSPYPRGYYKCSTVRGCPARKHVERASDDPTMLIVTYEAEHRHSMQDNISGGVGLVVFEST